MKKLFVIGLIILMLLFGCTQSSPKTSTSTTPTNSGNSSVQSAQPTKQLPSRGSEAVAIKSMWLTSEDGNLSGYFILEDDDGSSVTSDGNATLILRSFDGEKEYSRTKLNFKKGEFIRATLGQGAFEHEDIVWAIPKINLKEIVLDEDETNALYSMNGELIISTQRGRTFNEEETVLVDKTDFTIRKLSECINISNLTTRDVQTSYSKKFELTGTVKNSCGSTKKYVKIAYKVYDASDTLLKEDEVFVDPTSLPPNYSGMFKIGLTYESEFTRDIPAYPRRYEVEVEN